MMSKFIAAQDVIARMFSLHDRRSISEQLDCFTEDGAWIMSGNVVLNGREAISQRLYNRSKTIVTAHIVGNFTLDTHTDDEISVGFYLQIYAQDDGASHSEPVQLTATPYVNTLSAKVVNVGGRWKIKELKTEKALFTTKP